MALALNGYAPGGRISGTVITNLRFADDIALLAECEYNVQCLVDNIDQVSSRFGWAKDWQYQNRS